MGKIFVRERRGVKPGTGQPRFAVVAAMGTDLEFVAVHYRRSELEKLAEEAEAELIYLPRGEHAAEEDTTQQRGMGRRHKHNGGKED